MLNRLKENGIKPKRHIIDNEIFYSYQETIKENGIKYELVLSGMHYRNLDEKVMQIFKGHFKSVLCRVNDLWYRLISQTEMQVNLLLQANATPKISAYAYLNGPHDFNQKTLAPFRCAVQIHEHPDHRASWSSHSANGW